MPQRAKVSMVVCSAMFMAGLDLFIVNLAFPQIGREFHGTSLPMLSWVLTAYAIVYAALLVPAGRFADRTGRKRSFLIGLSVFTVSSLACAAAPSVAFLIAGRMVQAAGAGLLVPPSLGFFGTSTADVSLSTVRDGWALILVTAVLSVGTALAIGGRAPAPVPEAAASRATP